MSPTADKPDLNHSHAGPLRVLAVDDHADTADSLAWVLADYGYQAGAAQGDDEALRSAEAAWPDVVLLELRMHGVDGYETAHRLRAMQGGRRLLLVAVTGSHGTEAARRAYLAGVHLFFRKPLNVELLLAVLDHYRELRRATEARLFAD